VKVRVNGQSLAADLALDDKKRAELAGRRESADDFLRLRSLASNVLASKLLASAGDSHYSKPANSSAIGAIPRPRSEQARRHIGMRFFVIRELGDPRCSESDPRQ
jgi:hypothetical protein